MPMKPATYSVRRSLEHLLGGADLLEPPGPHDRQSVGERERLALIVGDEDRGEMEPLVQLVELGAHQVAQSGVEVAQRLVEQHDVRTGDEAAGERDTLLLAAAELRRVAVEQRLAVDQLRRLVDPVSTPGCGSCRALSG